MGKRGGEKGCGVTVRVSAPIRVSVPIRVSAAIRVSRHHGRTQNESHLPFLECAVAARVGGFGEQVKGVQRRGVADAGSAGAAPSSHDNAQSHPVLNAASGSSGDAHASPAAAASVPVGRGVGSGASGGSGSRGRGSRGRGVGGRRRGGGRESVRCRYPREDISLGKEVLPIPWVNDVNDEQPPATWLYMKDSWNASDRLKYVSSLDRHDTCCPRCRGDCIGSIRCACTEALRGTFAYTRDGTLTEAFLREVEMEKERSEEAERRGKWQYCRGERLLLCPHNVAQLEHARALHAPPWADAGDDGAHGRLGALPAGVLEACEACPGHPVRTFIKECFLKCGCSRHCGNRVVQRGITRRLQVFMTEGKGWGVRTLERLPRGAFVFEYAGEVVTNTEMDERNQQQALKQRGTFPVNLDADWAAERGLNDDEALCLDATRHGNVARFVNHRCGDSNLVDVPVEIEYKDHNIYHVAFFTRREIEPMEELTWDYNYDFNGVSKLPKMDCLCGSSQCRNPKPKRKRQQRR
ncbi:hypothetical protein CLOM_g13957 [Closterium sp. NIES-68]|nr:hypothetical protein CLOM_g13957 [Closterium sp. NIES-68]